MESLTLEGQVNNLIISSSFNSDQGRVFIALAVFLIVNVIISLVRGLRSTITYIIVNITLVFIFTSLDFIPIWVSMGVVILLVMMMLFIFNKNEGEAI